MPQPAQYQAVNIQPLSGPMDTRSTPDAVPAGAWRFRQNVMVVDQGKACRRPGWARYRHLRPIYNNEDLHDQLLSLQTFYANQQVPYAPQSDITIYPPGNDASGRPFCSGSQQIRTIGRQPVTFLFEAISTTGVRHLLAGTQNRIYALDEGAGNWQIISDAYGGEPGDGLHRRWKADQVNDVVVLTNNYDPVLAYTLDSAIQGCAMQAVLPIESLNGIGLTKAAVVVSWKGTIFLADVEMDGERIEYRVVWSRFKLPLNFTPGLEGGNGTAGFENLPYGGRILGMAPIQDVLLIYTTTGIWMCESVGGDQVFNFTQRYSEPENGEGCIAYRNTLVSTGKDHLYLGRDGIYTYNLFLPRPDRVEWMHRATSQVFGTIDELACDRHVATFYPATKEYWLSWVQVGESLPSRTLVLNTLYETSDFIDAGFSAYTNHAPDDRGTLLDFLLSRGLCTPAELAANADLITLNVKQGGFCDPAEAPVNPPVLPNRNIPIWTNNSLDLDGRLIEDYTQPRPDAVSLCSLLGDLTIEDLCQECAQAGLLVMASSLDWCLKEYSAVGGAYYHEVALVTTPCGQWRRDGYETILRTGAQDYGLPREDKNQRALELEYEVPDIIQVIPSALQMSLGYSSVAVDSNNDASGRCALVWRPLKPKTLQCLNDRSGYDQVQEGTRPNKTMNWTFLYTGRYFYFEMRIEGLNGAVCFSRLTAEVRQMLRSSTS
jgi:hypothetical protein